MRPIAKTDDVDLPIPAEGNGGSWVFKNSLPPAGSEAKELANAERVHQASPSAHTLDELAKVPNGTNMSTSRTAVRTARR
ncbi:hypothetical protein [Streptomyces sp. NPDC007100]|uniref:hypothetical protein n=1 Tax=Streptomyces sp. NPDC007100 TaxID=3155602 RepID=UPI0033D2FE9A